MKKPNLSQQRNYLITGGSGFIGSHLIEALLKQPNTNLIIVVDKEPLNVAPNDRLQLIFADIRKPLDILAEEQIDVCFHLAAVCREPGYNEEDYYLTNYLGTANIISLAERWRIPTIVFTSTIMVYPPGDQMCDETYPPLPQTAYGKSKLLAENLLNEWAGGSRTLRIVRPGVVFGRGENGNFTRLYRALKRGYFCYIGRKDTVKGNVYVKDLVSCLLYLAFRHSSYTIFNCVSPKPYTIAEIVETMCSCTKMKRYIPTLPYSAARTAAWFGSLLHAFIIDLGIHPLRIDKLYFSTNVVPRALIQEGFCFRYNLKTAIKDWITDCGMDELW